jgi:eukaryotic-like serine/threonine-protein kinase
VNPERWERLEQLFHAALEQEPGSRARFLREACGGDQSLRREVEALLARQAESPEFLESPALHVEAQALADELRAGGSASVLEASAEPRPAPPRRRARSTRPPWWMYVVGALFLCDWLLNSYCIVLGPRGFDFQLRWEAGRLLVTAVAPGSASARAGMESGDVVLALDGRPVRPPHFLRVVRPNLETGRTYRFDLERAGQAVRVSYPMGRVALGDRWTMILWEAEGFLLFATALLIGFRRPHDFLARVGALALATLSISLGNWADLPPGGAVAWRSLPAVPGALLWAPAVVSFLVGPILLTFFVLFPRPLFRARWPWAVIWLPALCFVPIHLHNVLLLVYRPEHAYDGLFPAAFRFAGVTLYGLYGLLSLAALAVNYFRLTDLNDRRRLRVLFIGGGAAVLPGLLRLLIWRSERFFGIWNWLSSGLANVLLTVGFVLFPLSFAYSILRHRLLDVRVIIRQGLQYAAARGVLLSIVPILGAVLLADLLIHGEEPLIDILKARGWVYAVVAGTAAVAHSLRRRWAETIDRRFFREQYDARRVLRDVASEVGRARGFDATAVAIAARIETALHPEFVAVMHRPVAGAAFETLASSPPDQAPPPMPTDGVLMSSLRAVGNPLDVLMGESGWLQRRLPNRELEIVRRARIDLIVPIAVVPTAAEALLVLGAKRSEEPYTSEDRDLLVAIALNLELLLERPKALTTRASEAFEQCPQCDRCYDAETGHCSHDGAALAAVTMPRRLAGRYRLERRLGSGGMGTVYEATDSALGRRVALKVVREDRLGSPGAAQRFEREARAAAGFPHPNVVAVYDYGIDAGARAFLVMELLTGVTLRDELRSRQRLDADRVIRIFRGVCDAAEAAHLRRLIHRDLKPENIFLACGGDTGGEVVKVLDFGIAKSLPGFEERAGAWDPAETDAGVVVGTPGYMSPEQLLGEEPDVSWDLWALAVTAYESLTGVLPFPATSREEWRRSVLRGQHVPLARHLPSPPAAWEEFFARSLAADRDTRPRSAADLLHGLEHALTPPPRVAE